MKFGAFAATGSITAVWVYSPENLKTVAIINGILILWGFGGCWLANRMMAKAEA